VREAIEVLAAGAASPRLVLANGATRAVAAHIVRRVAVLVLVVPVLGMMARRRAERTGRPIGMQILYAGYTVAGLFIGGAWIWRAGASVWEHVLRLLVILVVAAPLLRLVRQWRAKRAGRPARYVPVKQLIAAKLTLIVVAAGVQIALEHLVSRTTASVIVGVALAGAVALGGPQLQRHLIRRRQSRP
jgi:glucose dehydrogenase